MTTQTPPFPLFNLDDLKEAKRTGTPYTFRFNTNDHEALGLLQWQVNNGWDQLLESYVAGRSYATRLQLDHPFYEASTVVDYIHVYREHGFGCITGTWFGNQRDNTTPTETE
ncbi:hypothetical protein DWU98_09320 [Dyella monticola]|uniref:Uncharacterized protein n=1 Tax=Dyella monticola TaxID=1927958 RepID=A0A370X1T3_9GAMM|nr:hypothetical protein [Dyella monticola]RDS82227.1 hypothetical protein DWU98_09320 [Dyella monticola]